MVEPADFRAGESDDEKIRGKTDGESRAAGDPAGVAADE